MPPTIEEVELVEFTFPLKNTSMSHEADSIHGVTSAANLVYNSDSETDRHYFALKVETDVGISGEYVGRVGDIGGYGRDIVGKNPLDRGNIWRDSKNIGPVDIALWDFAGKYYEAPIHELIGTCRTELPTYASAAQGDESGGLDSPEAYADFAEKCIAEGFRAFKIHSWVRNDTDGEYLQREKDTIRAVRRRVGEDADLMLDPFGQYRTLGEAIKVGKVCDSNNYFWYEDPCKAMTRSQNGSRKLRQILSTPVLETENVHGLQSKTDYLVTEATDFLRVNPEFDGGITGAIKAARIAEGFGMDIEYHAVGPAQRHCMAVTRNSNYYEMNLLHPDRKNVHYPPVYEDGYSDEFGSISNDGMVTVPSDPGLGVCYDWEYIYANAENIESYS